MSNKTHPDWVVSIPVKVDGKNGSKTYWNRCGVGFDNPPSGGKEKSISIKLNSLPCYGNLVLFPFSPDLDAARTG